LYYIFGRIAEKKPHVAHDDKEPLTEDIAEGLE
jgi:hypothetical protein